MRSYVEESRAFYFLQRSAANSDGTTDFGASRHFWSRVSLESNRPSFSSLAVLLITAFFMKVAAEQESPSPGGREGEVWTGIHEKGRLNRSDSSDSSDDLHFKAPPATECVSHVL